MSMRYVNDNLKKTVSVDSLTPFFMDFIELMSEKNGIEIFATDITNIALFDNAKTKEVVFRFTFQNNQTGKFCIADQNFNVLIDDCDSIVPLFYYPFLLPATIAKSELTATLELMNDESAKKILSAFNSLCMLYSNCDTSLDIYQFEKDGKFGVVDCMGKVLIPPKYFSIDLLPIERVANPALENRLNITLLVASTTVDKSVCDVYDPNGHLLYDGVEKFKADYALTFFSNKPTQYGELSLPTAHRIFKVTFNKTIPITDRITGKSKPSDQEFELFYADILSGFPKEMPCPPRARSKAVFRRPYRSVNGVVALQTLKDVLFSLAQPLSELLKQNPKEIMLCAPFWLEIKEIKRPIYGISLDANVKLLNLSARIRMFLRRNNINTIKEFLAQDVPQLAEKENIGKDMIKQLNILKYRILHSLENNE